MKERSVEQAAQSPPLNEPLSPRITPHARQAPQLPATPQTPIVPFEPVRTDQVPVGQGWISQIKWDGVRMLAYLQGGEVQLFNRQLHARTLQYPELQLLVRAVTASSLIVDGEIIALDGQRPSFQEVMRRDSVRKGEHVKRAMREVPVVYMVFDVLCYNGEWMINRPLGERQELLSRLLTPSETLQTVQNFTDGPQLLEVMRTHHMEGIVSKHLESTYVIGGKDDRWRKCKVIRELHAVVGGVTFNQGRVNALLLGLYDQAGLLHYIGHAGSGRLSGKDWTLLTAHIAELKAPQTPFAEARPPNSAQAQSQKRVQAEEQARASVQSRAHAPQLGSRHTHWLKPVLKVKVHYLEWTTHGTLRQPVLQAFVLTDDASCTFDQL